MTLCTVMLKFRWGESSRAGSCYFDNVSSLTSRSHDKIQCPEFETRQIQTTKEAQLLNGSFTKYQSNLPRTEVDSWSLKMLQWNGKLFWNLSSVLRRNSFRGALGYVMSSPELRPATPCDVFCSLLLPTLTSQPEMGNQVPPDNHYHF